MRKIFLAFIGLMTVAPLALGQAKDFPNRAIKVIVPFTAGSGSDTSARFFGEKMSAILGQTVVVENRALCALNDDAINPRAPRPVSAWEGAGPDCGWPGRARGTIPGSFPDTTWPPL